MARYETWIDLSGIYYKELVIIHTALCTVTHEQAGAMLMATSEQEVKELHMALINATADEIELRRA